MGKISKDIERLVDGIRSLILLVAAIVGAIVGVVVIVYVSYAIMRELKIRSLIQQAGTSGDCEPPATLMSMQQLMTADDGPSVTPGAGGTTGTATPSAPPAPSRASKAEELEKVAMFL